MKNITAILIVIVVITMLTTTALAAGPWKGRIIDIETKEPIEGAVVLAVWERVYRTPAGDNPYFYEAKEVLTDKEGRYEILSYMPINLLPIISYMRGPEFTIFKPGYEALRGNFDNALNIFAIGHSTIGYLELGKETINGHIFEVGSKKTKTYPEGLIFSGKACKERIDSLMQYTPFMIGYIFFPLDGAREKIKRLEIPLDCPKDGEPVPSVDQTYNFRNDIEGYINKSFWIVELSKLKTREEREKMISFPSSIPDDKMPKLIELMNKEAIALGFDPSHLPGGSK